MRLPNGSARARRSRRSARAPRSSSKAEDFEKIDAVAARRRATRLYSGRDVARACTRLAADISPRIEATNPVVLAVMHGGAFAALELCKRFRFPHEFDYVHVTRYRGDVVGGALDWRVRPRKSLAGRTVLVVDDILDRGHTLTALREELRRVGVAAQYAAVLVSKRLAKRETRPRADFVGLEVDDLYVFGSGMDYRGYWRELRGIYGIDAGAEHG
jgi:hypoxanthine phosphoribosyltransferase